MDEVQAQVAQEEVTQPVIEEVKLDQQKEPEVAVESDQERNLRALRELKEKAERERDEAIAKYKGFQETQKKPEEAQQSQQELAINPDDLVEGKHLSAVDKKVRALEKQLQQYQQQSTMQSVETRLKAQYPDIDQVVSKENVEILRTAYPELSSALAASSDMYSKATATYTLIKKFGIHQDKNFSGAINKVKSNLSKPVSTSSIAPQRGESPLTKANAFAEGLTPDLKKKLYREMVESSKKS